MKINKGPHKGKRIETNQIRLSKLLKELFGAPKKYSTYTEARKEIGKRRGVISFQRMPSYSGGHIDLVYPDSSTGLALECASGCHWGRRRFGSGSSRSCLIEARQRRLRSFLSSSQIPRRKSRRGLLGFSFSICLNDMRNI
jgi:hypothetical protein